MLVSAGNHNLGWAGTTRDAEETLADYPDYLFQPECGLCEPATAAIAVTVGSVAEFIEPAVQRGARAENLNKAVADVHEPTPVTRIGPGLNGAVKPEFVAPGGNIVFEGLLDARRAVDDDAGVSTMSFAHTHLQGLFGYGSAARLRGSAVADLAALIWHSLKQYFGEDPHPNLVRALLAAAADVPAPLETLIQPDHGAEGVQRVCGYGLIDEDYLLHSGDRRVTLVTQSSIRIDSFLVFEVPVPAEFRRAEGDKRVIVSLAYDPPVRRTGRIPRRRALLFADPRQDSRRGDRSVLAYHVGQARRGETPSGETAGSVSGTVQVPTENQVPRPWQQARSNEQNGHSSAKAPTTAIRGTSSHRGPGTGLRTRSPNRTSHSPSPWKLPRSRSPQPRPKPGAGTSATTRTGTGLIGFISTGCGHGISGRSAVN